MDIPNLRWWGWGTLERQVLPQERPAFWSALKEWLELPAETPIRPAPAASPERLLLRSSRLDRPVLSPLYKLLGEEAVRTDRLCRVEHAYGKSYRDLVRLRAGYIPHPPDAVVYPADQFQVIALLRWAADRDIAVVPFGGGSSVVGGVEPPPDDRLFIALDLARLDRVLTVDAGSLTAHIQAGATGPEVEAQLNARGFTLGHFPDSFEFSTLGGWIATRSVGQGAIGYGDIAALTLAVKLVTPMGIIETKDAHIPVSGPNLLEQLIGSGGCYGVITEATMRIRPLPATRDYRGILFHSLEDGLSALRELVRTPGLHPALVRLSDGAETTFMATWHGLPVARYALDKGKRPIRPLEGSALMLLGFEGDAGWVAAQWRQAMRICREYQGSPLGGNWGRLWEQGRFTGPYLRDLLLDLGLLVGALEAATTWPQLMRLYQTMVVALKAALKASEAGPGLVLTHIYYASEHWALLRAVFIGRQPPGADLMAQQAQWQEIRNAAIEAILDAGGMPVCHSVGRELAPWLNKWLGPLGLKALHSLKVTFDPADIMNPGLL